MSRTSTARPLAPAWTSVAPACRRVVSDGCHSLVSWGSCRVSAHDAASSTSTVVLCGDSRPAICLARSWLRQGWAYLDEPIDVGSPLIHPVLVAVRDRLQRGRFATVDVESTAMLAAAFGLESKR